MTEMKLYRVTLVNSLEPRAKQFYAFRYAVLAATGTEALGKALAFASHRRLHAYAVEEDGDGVIDRGCVSYSKDDVAKLFKPMSEEPS